MQLKLIAIGILALLGLSSVMKPRAFRVFLGGIGAICMVGFLSMMSTQPSENDGEAATGSQVLAIAKRLMGGEPEWTQSAERVSAQVLEDLRAKETAELDSSPTVASPEEEQTKPKARNRSYRVYNINVKASTPEQQTVDFVTQLQKGVNDHLAWFSKGNPLDPGVTLLSHSDIDPSQIQRSIELIRIGKSRLRPCLAFGDEFNQHIREQGRKKLIRKRMELTLLITVGCGAVLVFAYAVLKVLNRRYQPKRTDDYLTHSNVSLV